MKRLLTIILVLALATPVFPQVFGGNWSGKSRFLDINLTGDLYLAGYIYHIGDTDTYIRYQDDRIQIVSGTQVLIDAFETTQDYVKLGDGGDVDINLNDAVMVLGSNGFMGIGDATPDALLDVENFTISSTSGYIGADFGFIKTAGATDQNDNYYALDLSMALNQTGGTIGNLVSAQLVTTLTDGTVGTGSEDLISIFNTADVDGGLVGDDVKTIYSLTDIDGGGVDGSVYGFQNRIDIEASADSINGDIFGYHGFIDADEDPDGSVYMIYWQESSNVDFGLYQNGSADNYFGGDVGIGTTAPDGVLELNMSTAGQFRMSYNDADGSATDYAKFELAADGMLTLTTVDADAAEADIILAPDGFVGIGTSNPEVTFEVETSARDVSYITSTDAGGSVGPSLYLHRNSASPVKGDVAGKVGFLSKNSVSQKVEIAAMRASLGDTADGAEDGILELLTMQDGTNTVAVLIDSLQLVYMPTVATHDLAADNNETAMFIDPDDGEMGYNSSARRFKTNIRDMNDADWVYDLKPRTYTRKSSADGRTEYGLIAEEVAKVAPEDMTFSVDGKMTGVQYHNLIAPMIELIQEQNERITALEKRVAKLERKSK